MNPRNRAGSTVESERDAQTSADGHDSSPNGNGANGDGRARGGQKRRSTTATGIPMPERGTSSQRGASSSSVARKPAEQPVDAATPSPIPPPPIAVSPNGAGPASATGPVDQALTEPPTAERRGDAGATALEPPAPIPLPAAPSGPSTEPEPVPFDDAAMSEPFGIPMVETPQEQEEDVEPLPLPLTTTPPAARGSQAQPLPDPTWAPAAVPDVPFEPPYATTTTMTSHQVAPVPRLVGRRPRVRKVTRVVRHVDPWSVFKVALVFNLVLYGVLLTAGVLLWNVAYATGTIDNLERFFESFGWSEFEFNGGAIYHSAWIAGLFGVIGLTGAAVLGATLFNLITDLVGGVRMTVLEEEVVEKTTAPMRRFTVRRTAVRADPDATTTPGHDLVVEPETHPVTVVTEQRPAQPDEPVLR